ncbi:multidrug efflux RND transporter permease subunit [Sulfurimonas sp. HSL-3221]|uniref:efflux RND transporter permease subunit n=1 Tax=Thiomicrolovo sulfuroxydans TaxID=2894755 RepID=UPI001E48ED6E|nr:multidrug efflux RND transporter permease subunit [Sulfurimonas sp. HSL-3221]UFS61619.1 multidrug efflux RND transporter permease subunit [Sulfurimonas sp. HSL-3221]
MFSKFFIDRPIFASVLSIIVILAGVVAIKGLPVQEYPSIVPPQINVQAVYPGADAETLANTVAAPLEDAINGAKNMIYMTSTASPSGILTMSITFATGTDPSAANVDVNNRVQVALNKLPEEVRRQGVSVRERSPDMLRVIAFTSENRVHDALWLNNYALINVIDDIKRIPGVGDAFLFGSKEYALRVWLKPDSLAAYDLTVNDVLGVIRSQNVQLAAGQIGGEPAVEKMAYTYTVTTPGRLKTADEFGNILVRTNPDGSSLRLKDVARVELGAERYMLKGTRNKEPMAVAGVFLAPGANALEVDAALTKVLEEVSQKFPEDVRYHTLYDTTTFVKTSIEEVLMTLAEAIVMVVLIIYFFLGNVRATIIPVLAIPVSIVGTFAGLYIAGFSINLLTLFALILAIGLVVDDAIIVIENVERLLHERKELTVREATIEAMREITGPVIAIVFVLSAVFIPASLMGGFSGVMYQQFAMTIVISVVISGIVALSLTPALCNVFLRREEPTPILPIRLFNTFFARLTSGFNRGVRLTLKLALMNLLIFGVLIGAGAWLSQKLPTGLVPGEDKGVLMVLTYLMPGASLERTVEVQDQVADTLLADPLVESLGAMSGIDLATFAFKSDAGIAFAHLSDWSERTEPGQSADAMAGKFMMQMMQNKEAMIIPVNPPPIRGMSATGGFELYVQDRTGGDLLAFDGVMKQLVAKANERPELTRVRTTFNAGVPQYRITVNEDKAKALGVQISDIYTTLGSTFGTGYANDFNLYGRTYHVNVQLEPSYRESVEDYRDVFVRSSSGALIPISSLVDAKRIVGPSVVQRFNMFTAAQLSGQPAPGYSSGDAMRAIQEVTAEVLPEGYTIAWAGTSYQEQQVAGKGNNAFIFAIVFIFLILAALYESWMIPFTILMTVPFALLGATLAVYFRGLENDIYFQVGLVTLVGLTAKNAILIVEFAQQKLREGLDLYQATIEGARIRFRPIVMTSLAFIGGTLPLALSSGAGANSRHIIGTTVVGGMVMLTVVAIFFIPLFYYLIMRLRAKFYTDKGGEDARN